MGVYRWIELVELYWKRSLNESDTNLSSRILVENVDLEDNDRERVPINECPFFKKKQHSTKSEMRSCAVTF